MNKKAILGSLVVAAAFLVPASSQALTNDDFVPVVIRDAYGEIIVEQQLVPGNPLLVRTDHYLRLAPDARDSGAKPGGGGTDPGTDCESDAYKIAGWHWTKPWSAKSSDYASTLNGGAGAWDQQVAANLNGGISGGNDGTAGVQDFKNNIQWVNLGSSSTVAVTTTWAYRGSGEAVESDARYNTYYPWSTNGASNAMDVGHVGTHEIGHTFGLGHPSGSGIECLTMYAYVNYGVTIGRTLGDGDILGIKAVYP